MQIKIKTRYKSASETVCSGIVVAWSGTSRFVPFNYAANDPDRAAVIAALALSESESASLRQVDSMNTVKRWELTL